MKACSSLSKQEGDPVAPTSVIITSLGKIPLKLGAFCQDLPWRLGLLSQLCFPRVVRWEGKHGRWELDCLWCGVVNFEKTSTRLWEPLQGNVTNRMKKLRTVKSD